ncbi:MAG: hypothetical protein QQW96_06900, partial [Tychonema bourrellyi B0820]|nr:hypothetical protein [Tychonema bourrellyi B0820]
SVGYSDRDRVRTRSTMMIIYFLTINPPCFLRGARGDLGLIVKQQSLIGFDVKLTPMGSAVSLRQINCRDQGQAVS